MVWIRYRAGITKVERASVGLKSIDFTVNVDGDPVAVELSQNPDPDAEAKLLITTSVRWSVNAARQEALDALADRRIPRGIKVTEGEEPFLEDGTPSISIISNSLDDLFAEVLGKLSRTARAAALSLRLTHGLRVELRSIVHLGLEFSVDNAQWILIPPRISMRVGSYAVGTPLYPALGAELEEVLAGGPHIPVGHELMFEAEELAWSHPRSALVVSLAAIEVGIKELISALIPDASWLVENVPSPPLERLVADFLPTLPVRGHLPGTSRVDPKKELLDELKKAVKLRNELIHTGRSSPGGAWLDDWLSLGSSLLYAFDRYSGKAWAGRRISPEHVALIAS